MRALILGAGVIGVSIADALAGAGAEVTVLDKRGTGRGASMASAGILAPYTEAHSDSPLLPFGVRSLALFDDLVAALVEQTNHRVEYQRSGTLEIAFDVDASRDHEMARDWLDAIGVGADWIDAASLRGIEPAVATAALGALLIQPHGFIDVNSFVRALALRARLAGAIFAATVEAIEIVSQPGEVVVRAGDTTYAADVVVVATGSWSSELRMNGERPWAIRPVRGQLLVLTWPRDVALPRRVVWGPHCYAVPWPNHTLLVGATVEDAGFDERSTVAGVAALTSAVTSLLPQTADAALETVRVGLRPAAADNLPVIGPSADDSRVIVATGHFRNGVLLAPLTAEVVRRLILDGEHDPMLAAFSPNRFRPDRA